MKDQLIKVKTIIDHIVGKSVSNRGSRARQVPGALPCALLMTSQGKFWSVLCCHIQQQSCTSYAYHSLG